MKEFIRIPVLTVTQKIGEFYVGVMAARDLRGIAYADIRRQRTTEEDHFTGIQRELNEKRRKEIQRFIESPDATFPNSFIIEVSAEDATISSEYLEIKFHDRAAKIIDGQHRLAGFTDQNDSNFFLIVSIFIGLPVEDQAMMFANINLKQTRVNESLVYDLFEETSSRSPQKTAHTVAKSLNREPDSPFFQQIKPLGKKTEEYDGRLTQATFIKKLLPLIARDPEAVRMSIKEGGSLVGFDEINSECIFWRFFCREEDWAIHKIMKNYFAAVSAVFSGGWNSDRSPLGRTIGFSALMRLLKDLGGEGLKESPPRLDEDFFESRLSRGRDLAPFSFEKYPPSGSGETALFKALKNRII